jgi:hypothetical protein
VICGKIECKVADQFGEVHLTVAGRTCYIKQNSDLIAMSRKALRELATDIIQSLDDLEAGKAA